MPNNSPKANHLISEKSPYLLQHAYNPVDWHPWGKSAFDKARADDKPILLSIGYSTCHWCHVMAHESFEDVTIAKMINDHFIGIKVDREERPDIDHIYMSATTAMTGQGGWPLTVFLTPDGEPFYGGTYFPPYAKWGSVGFADLLRSITAAWQKDREQILSSGHSITDDIRRMAARISSTETMDQGLLERAFEQMKAQFDHQQGGFGSAPKFPMGHSLSFLLRYYWLKRSSQVLDMVEGTLKAMARGGIWDHLGGGFHRYSTDRYWHIPHFEKMLYDQALLSRVYLEAYQLTGLASYAQTAQQILDYVLRDMTDGQGGFYSAQDADSLEADSGILREGAFYVFAQPEIEQVLGTETALIFNYCYGVLPEGNANFDPHGEFRGKNILYEAASVKNAADKFCRQEDEIRDILIEAREKLSTYRNDRPRPYKDDKVLCDWNGLMISSFAYAAAVLGKARYTEAACKAADFVLGRMILEGRLYHRWREGEAGIAATLEDYAFFIYGLLEVYEAVFQQKYFDAARLLADQMIELFADPVGGFFMTAADAEILIIRPKEAYDGALPSGNSVAAMVLLKLHALTGEKKYDTQLQALFKSLSSLVSQAPYSYTFLLSALGWQYKGALEIDFQGPMDDGLKAQMLKLLYKKFVPYKAVKFMPAAGSDFKATICYQGICHTPVDNLEAFTRQLQEVLS